MKTKKNNKGFTLMELMIVIAILGLLTTLVVNNVVSNLSSAKISNCFLKLTQLKQNVEFYKIKKLRYPDSLKELTEPIGAVGKPILDEVPTDPWGNEYRYIKPGENGKPFTYKLRFVSGPIIPLNETLNSCTVTLCRSSEDMASKILGNVFFLLFDGVFLVISLQGWLTCDFPSGRR